MRRYIFSITFILLACVGVLGISQIASGAITLNSTSLISDGVLTLSGTGAVTLGSATTTAVTITTDSTGTAELVLPAGSIDSTELLDNTITGTDLSATLTLADADYLDLSAILHDDTALQGLRLPQASSATPSSPTSGEGQLAWDNRRQPAHCLQWLLLGCSRQYHPY